MDGNLALLEKLENQQEPFEYFQGMGLNEEQASIAEFLLSETHLSAEDAKRCACGEIRLNELISNCNIPHVVQQRELLTAFCNWWNEKEALFVDISPEKIEKYLGGL